MLEHASRYLGAAAEETKKELVGLWTSLPSDPLVTQYQDLFDCDDASKLANATVKIGLNLNAADTYYSLKSNELLCEGGLDEIDEEDSSLDSSPKDPWELIDDMLSHGCASCFSEISVGPKPIVIPKRPSIVIELLLEQLTNNQQSSESHLLILKNENRELCKKVSPAKKLSQQAICTTAAQGTHIRWIQRNLQVCIFALEQNQPASSQIYLNILNQLQDLCSDILAVKIWRKIWAERVESLETDMLDKDRLVLSQLAEIRSSVASGDSGAFSAGGLAISNEPPPIYFYFAGQK